MLRKLMQNLNSTFVFAYIEWVENLALPPPSCGESWICLWWNRMNTICVPIHICTGQNVSVNAAKNSQLWITFFLKICDRILNIIFLSQRVQKITGLDPLGIAFHAIGGFKQGAKNHYLLFFVVFKKICLDRRLIPSLGFAIPISEVLASLLPETAKSLKVFFK